MANRVRVIVAAVALLAASAVGSSLAVADVPVPTTSSFAPSSGPVWTRVIVSGTGLLGVTNVQIGGKDAQFRPEPDGTLTVLVPVGVVTGKDEDLFEGVE